MRDGTQRYLSGNEKKVLISCLSKQKKEIEKYLEEITESFFGNQVFSVKKSLEKNHSKFCSKREFVNGVFVCLMEKCSHNYTINYLNKLIDCILRAEEEWANHFNHPPHRTNLIPTLVSCKIGDLMRSKCSSK